MNRFVLFIALAVVFVAGAPQENRDNIDETLPSFEIVSGDTEACTGDVSLCIKVTYSDGSDDIIPAKESKRSKTVLKGRLQSTKKKVVIILADEDDSEDTIVFKSDKTGACTRFSVDLNANGATSCLNMAPCPGKDNEPIKTGPRPGDRTLEEIKLSPRELDPNGYKLNVMVYYDDAWKEDFGANAVTRAEAVMAVVDEMYSEKDTLKTEIDVNVVGIENAKGYDWRLADWNALFDGSDLVSIAQESSEEANLYVFLTGKYTGSGSDYFLGLAYEGVVCDSSRDSRFSINRYGVGSTKGGDAYTAETVTHEMGHNLGISHDFVGDNPRKQDGVECYGYMDYNDDTNQWSPCSVADFTSYINQQSGDFCLASLDEGTDGGTEDQEVCKDLVIVTKGYGRENSYELGSCKSQQEYGDDFAYEERCCMNKGTYTLKCMDNIVDGYGEDGWHGGYITIDGKNYCDDFTEGNEMTAQVSFG